jgi:hypothetical protein
MVEAENELPYCLSQLWLSSCCFPFISAFLHMCTNNCFHLIVKILYITTLYSSVFLPILGTLLVQGFIFEGDLQFSKFFKMTSCKGMCTLKWTEKRFIPFTPPPLAPLIYPPYRIERKPCLCHAECILWYIFQKLSLFQPSSPLYSIHPRRLCIPQLELTVLLLAAEQLQPVGNAFCHRVHVGVEEKQGECICPLSWSGAYTTTLLVMVDRVKVGGRASPTLTRQGLILPS